MKIFNITDHLQCGNEECFYDGEWCYHLTDKKWKEICEEIKNDLLDTIPISMKRSRREITNYFK